MQDEEHRGREMRRDLFAADFVPSQAFYGSLRGSTASVLTDQSRGSDGGRAYCSLRKNGLREFVVFSSVLISECSAGKRGAFLNGSTTCALRESLLEV